jgi:hypothetical protein
MKGIQNFCKSPFFVSMATVVKIVQLIFLSYLVPLDVDVVSIKFHQRRVTCYDHFCVFQLFSILAVSMATAAILKISNLHSTTSHGI